MVKKENFIYLLVGQDSLSKNIKLKKLKEEFLIKELEEFNIDTVYGKELTLIELQKSLLSLPLKADKRIVVIKDAQHLREDIKGFLLKYVKKPQSRVILVLDIDRQDPKNRFIKDIKRYCLIYHFRELTTQDTFTLNRQIGLKKTGYALSILNQLLKKGERPERILGGLRYVWENSITNPFELKKRLKLLLDCDIDIKTGRLKPAYALERFVVSLCSIGKPSH